MHLATIVAFMVAVIGFIIGTVWFFQFGVVWILFAIALLLFLMVRESTLSHVRTHGEPEGRRRYHAVPHPTHAAASPEGATAESSPLPPNPAPKA